MSFFEYVKDKRFFLAFYLVIMFFISIMVILSDLNVSTYSNLIYIHICCLLMVLLYITLGYFFKRSFYQDLFDNISSDRLLHTANLPTPQNNQQKLHLNLLKKQSINFQNELQKLYDEKKEQQDFIMSWIHEVKTPIAASRLLMEHSLDKSVEFLVDKLEDEIGKIDNYVEQALYFSRVDSFAKDYFIKEVSLKSMVKESVKKHAKLFINKDISLVIDDIDHFVQSDSKWLSYVIDQLIANALKYTNDGGNIVITLKDDRKEKKLIIKDDGIGINSEDINRVFEKGFTGSTGRTHTKSTGMGLYLAKQLAIKLGHEITIESLEGEYTKVSIHFPKIRNYYQL
ncbi:sensor histidine kinase [Sutcliffiella halmapala]|uniref:sensor histidine kinase n=1 Tax=Sutcliffiella halmapala TaxID=79882 RepID=UPI0009957108|nr:sensor histidine kinase [Sutcliffiella halmapala]